MAASALSELEMGDGPLSPRHHHQRNGRHEDDDDEDEDDESFLGEDDALLLGRESSDAKERGGREGGERKGRDGGGDDDDLGRSERDLAGGGDGGDGQGRRGRASGARGRGGGGRHRIRRGRRQRDRANAMAHSFVACCSAFASGAWASCLARENRQRLVRVVSLVLLFVILLPLLLSDDAAQAVAISLASLVVCLVGVRLAFMWRYRQRLAELQAAGNGGDGENGRLALGQLLRLNPELFRRNHIDPAHLRLAMMDRDFTGEDYDALLALDEAHREQTFTGLPQSQIERLPVSVYTPRHTSTGSGDASDEEDEGEEEEEEGGKGKGKSKGKGSMAENTEAPRCSICLETLVAGERMRSLLCLHRFHCECVDRWLRTKATCPVCNFPVQM